MSTKAKLRFVTFLTFVRFPLVLLFFAGAIVYATPRYRVPGLFFTVFGALILSAVTDLFDGYFARRFKVVTKFGAHMDPLMDKFFYLASLPLLVFVAMKHDHVGHGTVLLVLTLLFLARDQWVTFLRSIGAMYDVSGAANWSGKLRTAVNFPLICGLYYFEEAPPSCQFLNEYVVYFFELVALALTVMSFIIYTRHYWPYVRKAATISEDGGEGDRETKSSVTRDQ